MVLFTGHIPKKTLQFSDDDRVFLVVQSSKKDSENFFVDILCESALVVLDMLSTQGGAEGLLQTSDTRCINCQNSLLL